MKEIAIVVFIAGVIYCTAIFVIEYKLRKNKLKSNNMESLKISKEKAIELYPTAGKELQSIFEETFGKKTFLKDIKDMVKTIQDAIDIVGNDDKDVQEYLFLLDNKNRVSKYTLANVALTIVAKALNEGWNPDWTNSSQYKYVVYLTDYNSGFGFSRSGYGDWRTFTYVGSRLCFKSKELSIYAGEQFRKEYNDLFSDK